MLRALDEPAPDLAHEALLARLPDELRAVVYWLLREKLWIESDADWLGLLDELATCDADAPLDSTHQDRLITLLFLAGYDGQPDGQLQSRCDRIEEILES